ncbi:sensor histidine kinase [Hufsiella ginkgonis]|uniref:Histidine kinase n=1 Tax=Hufsiella ginkgonis TaxID=2695274 RepID=A0A7K1Y1S0_9SPHI|nr:histidine kinase [Hufsiella ginkgonis]MXV17203.1 histidine kinase [Hufsiella ginkgonis]
MYSSGDIYIGSFRVRRIWQHLLFWIAAYTAMIIIYGYSKTHYYIAARNNLFYTPVHVIYFYTMAYWLIPDFLLKKRIALFLLLMTALFFGAIYLTRFVDVAFVDPFEIRVVGAGSVWYPASANTFWKKVFDPGSFFGALKGVNLVVWIALAIKLFKMWLERRNAALQAELNFLKAQIHPHFLFNTLNNLYALTLNGSPQAPDVVLKLSDMMRYMLYECSTDDIELQKDVTILEEYIGLEKIRYEDRLEFSFSITGEIDRQRIAPLLLLPLVENAFKHGTSEVIGDTWINVNLQLKGDRLILKVSNSKPQAAATSQVYSGHIGLTNLKKRLELLYGDAYKLKFFDEEELFLAVLEIDLQKRLPV